MLLNNDRSNLKHWNRWVEPRNPTYRENLTAVGNRKQNLCWWANIMVSRRDFSAYFAHPTPNSNIDR